MIIGLTGLKRSGKSTAAKHLVEVHGFTELSFAAPLKAMALSVDPIIAPGWWDAGYDVIESTDARLSELVEEFGWENTKDHFPEARRFLQRLGTDGVRNHLGEHVWADKVAEQILDIRSDDHNKNRGITPIVIADVRFENEASVVRRANGSVAQVVRPGLESPKDTHASEAGVEWDYQLFNEDGNPEHMLRYLDKLVGWLSC